MGAVSTPMAEAAASAPTGTSGPTTQSQSENEGLELLREDLRQTEARIKESERRREEIKKRSSEVTAKIRESDRRIEEAKMEMEFLRQVQECRVKVQGVINEYKKSHSANEWQNFGAPLYGQFIKYRDKEKKNCPI